MSDTDSSSSKEIIKKRKYQKNKDEINDNYKKQKRSYSVESVEYERRKKKKSKGKHSSDDNSNKNTDVYKSKSKGYKERHEQGQPDGESNKRKNESKKTKEKERRSRSNSVDKSWRDRHKSSYVEYKLKNVSKNSKSNNTLRNRNSSESESDNDNRKHHSPPTSQKQYSRNVHTKSHNRKNENENDCEIGDDNMFRNFKNNIKSKLKEIGETSMSSEQLPKTNKSSNDNKKNKDSENWSTEKSKKNSPKAGDEGDRCSGSSEKPYRPWNTSRGPVRKNSDSYWNKYSDRLKETTERMEIGPRYYGTGGNPRKEKDNMNKQNEDINNDKEIKKSEETPRQKKVVDLFTSKTGGAYIPPAKLRMMQESISDKGSAAYQRIAWEALKKSIQGHVNKVNTSNIRIIIKAVVKENIVRGRGLLCRSLIQAQAASPTFTNVYASFVAVLNSKFPKIGELLLKRLVVQFRRGFKRNDKTICITAATFIAHLVNQEVAHEILALEILTMLIETPTDDSVEVAIAFMKECGMKLTEVSNKGILAIFDMLRNILHEGKLEKRVQYMIEVMFQIRKEDFKAHPSLIKELNLVEESEKIQHIITLEDNHDPEDILNVFKLDPDYEANEAKYKSLVADDSDEESEGDDNSGSGSEESDEDSDEEDGEPKENNEVIIDKTETNLVALRKTIYLTIQSSLDYEECAHKLLRMQLKPGQELELVHMFIDCCAEQRTYEKFFGLLSQRFCQINRMYIGPFEETFRDSYATIHRMANDKLRNIGKLFAHLFYTDAISWDVLATIRLNEDDTTSSSRIFIKILFLELSEYMGLAKLNQRVKDPSLQNALSGLFPRDNPKHTRFAINFFTSIGLGGLTDELREHLKTQSKESLALPQLVEDLSSSSSSSSSDSSDSSSSDSSSSASSSSDSEDRSRTKKKKRVTKNRKPQPKKIEKIKSSKKQKQSPQKRKRDR